MRTKLVPILLTVAVAGGVIALALHFRGGESPEATTTPEAQNQAAMPAPQAPAGKDAAPVSNPHPDLSVDGDGLSKAVVDIRTPKGTIRFKLYPNDAPKTVARILELVGQGFYNGLVFHRVVPGFVIQGGDPQGNGTGGSGQHLKAEFNKRQHRTGAVAMARAADPDSADSQFYITLAPQPNLDGGYTVFGQVIEGMDVVERIRPGDPMSAVFVETDVPAATSAMPTAAPAAVSGSATPEPSAQQAEAKH
ncbi:MAG TPA: peptidylprolyl isomerase [Bdellovibrionota bacterium]|jgi:cyclophilin family peptidyl-prolyl cis-trans isomerase|nr:peptidylprolyl isomerase [Bdellovibrionota bacterium]